MVLLAYQTLNDYRLGQNTSVDGSEYYVFRMLRNYFVLDIDLINH